MIRIATNEFWTDKENILVINERVKENTCKTNINPELMFRQSYNGMTTKLFVGNWTSDGFWISKYRNQFIQLRPDIITRFYIKEDNEGIHVVMKSSIGFSSIFTFLILLLIFSSSSASEFGINAIYSVASIFILLYILLSKIEYDRMLTSIKKTVFNDINITKSNFDYLPKNL